MFDLITKEQAGERLNKAGFDNMPNGRVSKAWFEDRAAKADMAIVKSEDFESFLNTVPLEAFEDLDQATQFLKGLSPIEVEGLNGAEIIYLVPKVLKNDNLIKSVKDAFQYGSKSLEFQKKGKEIKERLQAFCAAANARIDAICSQCSAMATANGWEEGKFEPMKAYGLGLEDNNTPAKFRRCTICDYKGDNQVEVSMGTIPSQREKDMDSCYKHNDLMREAVSLWTDCYYSEMLIRNMEDTKNYSLNAQQIQVLGF